MSIQNGIIYWNSFKSGINNITMVIKRIFARYGDDYLVPSRKFSPIDKSFYEYLSNAIFVDSD